MKLQEQHTSNNAEQVSNHGIKLCPLRNFQECIETKCAWWSLGCAVVSIAKKLYWK